MIKKLINRISGTGNVYSLLSNLIFSLFGFGGFLILVRVLEKPVFGQWILFLTVSSLFDMLRLGLNGAATIKLISAKKEYDEKNIVGVSYRIGLISTLILGSILFIGYFSMKKINSENIYLPILLFYPILSIINLPYNQSLVWAQGNINFKRVFIIRFIGAGLSFVFVTLTALIKKEFTAILTAYIISYSITSLIILILKWDGSKYILRTNEIIKKNILKFGKYSTASYIGSNLLRSSDTLLLSLAPFMGPEAIAVFAIPFKLVEIVEIPLRSFTATAFPRLSHALEQSKESFNQMLGSYTLWTTLLLIPVILMLAIFPTFFLTILGGKNFVADFHIQLKMVYIICIYILILPLDRYSGVALFALDKPKMNFIKIMLMLTANILFDLIAIFIFKSLVFVALATVIFTILGISIGWKYILQKNELVGFYKNAVYSVSKKWSLPLKT